MSDDEIDEIFKGTTFGEIILLTVTFRNTFRRDSKSLKKRKTMKKNYYVLKKTLRFGGFLVFASILFQTLIQAQSAVFEREFRVGDGTELSVSTSGGSIEVTGGSSDRVVVKAFAYSYGKSVSTPDLDNWEITAEEVGGKIVVKAEKDSNKGWLRGSNNISIGFEIEVPTQTRTEARTSGGRIEISNLMGEQKAYTSGGSLRAENIMGNIEMRTSGGSIRVEDIQGSADIRTSGGSIRARKVSGGLLARTSGGSLTLTEISGKVEARTSGGGIELEMVQPLESVDVATSGGSVVVEIPEDLGYDLELRGNRVRTELKNFTGSSTRDYVQGSMNGGGIPIRARTSGGSVSIRYHTSIP